MFKPQAHTMFIGGNVSVCFSKRLFAEKVGEKIGSCLELTRSCKDAKTTESLCKDCAMMQQLTCCYAHALAGSLSLARLRKSEDLNGWCISQI